MYLMREHACKVIGPRKPSNGVVKVLIRGAKRYPGGYGRDSIVDAGSHETSAEQFVFECELAIAGRHYVTNKWCAISA